MQFIKNQNYMTLFRSYILICAFNLAGNELHIPPKPTFVFSSELLLPWTDLNENLMPSHQFSYWAQVKAA